MLFIESNIGMERNLAYMHIPVYLKRPDNVDKRCLKCPRVEIMRLLHNAIQSALLLWKKKRDSSLYSMEGKQIITLDFIMDVSRSSSGRPMILSCVLCLQASSADQ